ncbi:MAG TPA: methyltransferase domain-containing protein [Chryseosolibacter sp.]|nr:methyltransferase domain-containing protein [Chryseosolibacter sp.]
MSETTFSQSKYELAYPAGVENHYWTRSRLAILHHVIKTSGLSRKKVLEIGCGKGIVVAALRHRDIDCTGVELADVTPISGLAPFVRQNQDATMLEKKIRDSVEVILLLDVIEHIEDPHDFMHKILVSFINARHLIFTVPARTELWSNYDEFYGHFRRYDLEQMQALGTKLHLNVLTNRYFFHSLYLAGAAIVRVSKKRPVRIKAPRGLSKLIHMLLAAFLYLEFLLIPGRIRGSSIITVFSRN